MKIVVAIDSQKSADTALKFLTDRKHGKDDRIHLVHVIVPGFADAPVAGIPDVVAEEKNAEQKLLAELSAAIDKALGAKVTTEIVPGSDVGSAVADVCTRFGADEAVVPSHMRHGLSRFFNGSVAEEIVGAAPCNVVVLKMAEAVKR